MHKSPFYEEWKTKLTHSFLSDNIIGKKLLTTFQYTSPVKLEEFKPGFLKRSIGISMGKWLQIRIYTELILR